MVTVSNNDSVNNVFEDIDRHANVHRLAIDNSVAKAFTESYSNHADRLYFEVAKSCGGIVIDNWTRLYGCGELNIVEKNEKIRIDSDCDLLIGEDVCGGLFAIKNNTIHYFSPTALMWTSLNLNYNEFLYWLINDSEGVSRFYATCRWRNWTDYVKGVGLDKGISFMPPLCADCNIEDRSRRIINIDELIRFNIDLSKQLVKSQK